MRHVHLLEELIDFILRVGHVLAAVLQLLSGILARLEAISH